MKMLLFIVALITLVASAPIPGQECKLIYVESLDDIPGTRSDWYYTLAASGFWDGTVDTEDARDGMYANQQPAGTPFPNQCLCPNGVTPETVVYGDISQPKLHANGTLCGANETGCVKLGMSIGGHTCMAGAVNNQKRKCVTRYISTKDRCDMFALIETTHAPVCVCTPPAGGVSVAKSYIAGGTRYVMPPNSTTEPDNLLMVVYAREDHAEISGPILCRSTPEYSLVTVIKTEDRMFHIAEMSVYKGYGVDTHSLICDGFTADESHTKVAQLSIKLNPDPICDCNNRSIADLYSQFGYHGQDGCVGGKCVCQHGWTGDRCETCLYTDFIFGCEQTTQFIWIIISLCIVLVGLVAFIITLYVTQRTAVYVYKKLKNE